VFTKTGLVLFKHELVNVKGDPVDALIRTVLLEGRATTEHAFSFGAYSVKWQLANKHDLVFVAVYNSMLAPPYVDHLLDIVSRGFCKMFKDEIADASGMLDFKEKFEFLLREAEHASRKPKVSQKEKKKVNDDDDDGTDDDNGDDSKPEQDFGMYGGRESRKERAARGPRAYQGKKSRSPKTKPGKEKRAWGEQQELTEEEAAALDVAGIKVTEEEKLEAYVQKCKDYMPEEGELADIDKESDDDYDDDSSWSFGSTKIGSFFASMTGQKALTREDIKPTIETMEKQLLSKNVSTVASREICEAVAQDLEGKKLGSFTRGITTAVRESSHAALQRLLTPKRSTDILREARIAKSEGRPYTIVFIGVNGVGKSTSLSKVAYYLKHNGLSVQLCACDTFRSGAVEQLKVHARNLDIPLFEQGYNKDAASVAVNGVKHAAKNGIDVVLIDTAGRMQNNEPLMRQLTKLIANNRPDLILFVGEALVGNDGTDQLVHFDKALKDYSDSANPRTIDGMILTKFDTIDDKVGAAVSMVHSTGQPIIFVGTGQKYTNLNKLNVSKILKSLLA